jgi:hypothetical protein
MILCHGLSHAYDMCIMDRVMVILCQCYANAMPMLCYANAMPMLCYANAMPM